MKGRVAQTGCEIAQYGTCVGKTSHRNGNKKLGEPLLAELAAKNSPFRNTDPHEIIIQLIPGLNSSEFCQKIKQRESPLNYSQAICSRLVQSAVLDPVSSSSVQLAVENEKCDLTDF